MTARMDAALSRLGDAAARRRVVTLLVWGLLLVGPGLAATLVGPATGPAADGPTAPSTRAQQALDRLGERIPGAADPTGWVVLVAPDGTTVDDPAVTESVDRLVAGLRDLPGVTAVVDPVTGGTVSADRRTAFVPLGVAASAVTDTRPTVQVLADTIRSGGPAVELGGVLVSPAAGFGPGIAAALAAGVALAGLVAGLVLGSLRGGLLAIGSVLVGSGVGLAAGWLLAGPLGLTGLTGMVAFVVGLAVGGPGAVGLLGRSARPGAVVGGGLLVMMATAGLAVSGVEALTVVGSATAIVVLASELAALTLLPALVSLTGGPLPAATDGEPRWWARLVTGRPALALGGVAVALAVVVVPALIVGGDRAGGSADRAEELLAAEFGPGAAGPLLLTVQVDRSAELAAALPAVADQVRQLGGVALAAPGRVSADGSLGVVTVLPSTGPADPATRDLLHRLRALPPDAGGAVIEVTGATAVAIDVADELTGAIPRYLLIIGPLLLILLILLVRPWTLGLVAAAGSVLSIGVTVVVTGALAGRWVPGLDMLLPVVALAVLLGLVLDQAVRAASGWPGRRWSRTVGGAAVMVARSVRPPAAADRTDDGRGGAHLGDRVGDRGAAGRGRGPADAAARRARDPGAPSGGGRRPDERGRHAR